MTVETRAAATGKPPHNIQVLLDAGLVEFIPDAAKSGEPPYRLTPLGQDWHDRVERGRLH